MDGFTRVEVDGSSADLHALRALADQMHLNPRRRVIPDRAVFKCRQVEVCSEFAIDAGEQVEVETGRHSRGVIIGRHQDVSVLAQVDADQELACIAKQVARRRHEAEDVLIGLASSGVHANGYSLVRKGVEQAGLGGTDAAPFGGGTMGDAFLAPTRIYVKAALAALYAALVLPRQGFMFGMIYGAALFEKLGLPVVRKTPKGQPSTAEDVLQELATDYQLPGLILEYRSVSKLKSTYTDKLPQQINPRTGRVRLRLTGCCQAVDLQSKLLTFLKRRDMMSFRTSGLAALCATAVAFPAFAGDASSIKIEDPYARVSSASAKSGAAFLVIQNTGATDDRLIAAQSDVAKKTELHTHKQDANGVMRMIHVEEGFAVPAGETHALARGGDHVMFLGLTRELAHGDELELTLVFENAGEVTVTVPVDLERNPMRQQMQGHGHMNHGTMGNAASD